MTFSTLGVDGFGARKAARGAMLGGSSAPARRRLRANAGFGARVAVWSLAATLAHVAPSAAEDAFFQTAGGLRVETPPINSLDCTGMSAVLASIDETGYRRGSPTTVDPADQPLFAYESKLSVARYETCDGSGGVEFRNGFTLTPSAFRQ